MLAPPMDIATNLSAAVFKPIRILLVDDSVLALTCLTRILDDQPDMTVVGTASNGKEALRMICTVNPTIICSDLNMPVMNGLELTRRIMTSAPRPILVISNTIGENTKESFDLLEAGAVDVCSKPAAVLGSGFETSSQMLVDKIRVVAGVSVFTHHSARKIPPGESTRPETHCHAAPPNGMHMVAIGASTGGPKALLTILQALPANFPVPILCVQHICDGFLDGLVGWLDSSLRIKVRVANPGKSGEKALPGTIYFPPGRKHLEVDHYGRLHLSPKPPVDGHRPSVTVLFESVARSYGSSAIGILLTGMGVDGATGLHSMAEAGAVTIAQDETSCAVFGMPKAAVSLGAARHVLPPDEIASKLLRLCRRPFHAAAP